MKTISKTVTTNYVPQWVAKNWMLYDEQFANARGDKKDKMSRCFKCNWPFQISQEWVSLVAFKGHGNKLVCKECADWILDGSKPIYGGATHPTGSGQGGSR